MDREILSIVLIFVFLLLLTVVFYLNNSSKIDNTLRKKLWDELLQIKKMIEVQNPLTYRDIIIRLDSLLARTLKLYYKNNESCGTNLKRAKDLFEKEHYNKIWQAHKLRNKIVHENIEITSSELLQSYDTMRLAIKKLLYEK